MTQEPPPKWRIVENIVAALERITGKEGGWHVTANAYVRQRTAAKRRQVDVHVECPSGERTFVVGIDVKDERKPLDIETVEQLCSKAEKLAIDRYVIVSTSGYTEQALEEAVRRGVLATTLKELDVGEVIGINWIRVVTPKLRSIGVTLPEGSPMPPMDELGSASLETTDGPVALHDLCAHYARESISENEGWGDGQFINLDITDERKTWQALRLPSGAWPAPVSLRVSFEVTEQEVLGHLYRSEDGKEVLTAVVPGKDGAQQVTIATVPEGDGTHRIAVTVAEAAPKRKHV